ncbi:UDP-N-acetylglucosamine 2-epimerase [Anaerobacterium chartisolvens]|uniref:UDP-N-acetylglucosamine 2-epimerase (non-hydrolyzing) n=1 Tax=Anaerobacterium chartisolvens TaxID=1297424 RepID=A0A369B1N7_9FIRM|nr:UDP-N-acetylglucosamine 2-epimerase (non-hydrolyzing) [Anaerobacterium chartisolvens]RCX14327.1 UDP-N-acetylglucosamine 2-epimerase [Anaerobacterium chartisolvens]
MKKLKVMTVFGTRPEAIKMAPLVKELEGNEKIQSVVCVTAQHRQMLDQVLNIFNIRPDYDLNIMKDMQTLAGITTRAIEGLNGIFADEKPDIVLVHGDTTTTFAGSLAAFYNKIPVGHVEAGLRTFDKYSPYPEEMNRKLTGALADMHFAPTGKSRQNLLNENIPKDKIYVTGNTAIDALKAIVTDKRGLSGTGLPQIDYPGARVIVVTAHRRENLGEPLKSICRALRVIADKYADVHIIYPVHLNPAVQNVAREILGGHERIHLIDPPDYQEFAALMNKSCFIMTDSGGVQEEAPSLGKPVLVLRNETERPEGISAGTLKLAGTDEDRIIALAGELLEDASIYGMMSKAVNPYGDGQACKRIAQALLYQFKYSSEKPCEFGA